MLRTSAFRSAGIFGDVKQGVRYVDECDALLLEETWVQGPGGLQGTARLHVPSVDGTQHGYGFKLWRPIGDLTA